MKKLEIIVRPGVAAAVRQAIEAVGYPGITISQAEGHGSQKGLAKEKHHGKFRLEMVPKMRLDIVIPDSALDMVVDAVIKTARTGQPGDGKIFVSDISDIIRIRTGEKGEKAIG